MDVQVGSERRSRSAPSMTRPFFPEKRGLNAINIKTTKRRLHRCARAAGAAPAAAAAAAAAASESVNATQVVVPYGSPPKSLISEMQTSVRILLCRSLTLSLRRSSLRSSHTFKLILL